MQTQFGFNHTNRLIILLKELFVLSVLNAEMPIQILFFLDMK